MQSSLHKVSSLSILYREKGLFVTIIWVLVPKSLNFEAGYGNAALHGSSKMLNETVDRKAEERVSVEELKKMTLRQLRELATLRSLPENGTKKELVERLLVDAEKDSEEHIEGMLISRYFDSSIVVILVTLS